MSALVEHLESLDYDRQLKALRRVHGAAAIALAPIGASVDARGLGDETRDFEGRVGVWSSGSTGRPKLVWRSWSEVLRDSGYRASGAAYCWGTSFEPWSFAGVTLGVHALMSGGEVHGLGGSWAEVWEMIRGRGVNALSVPSTFMRMLLVSEPADRAWRWRPKQLTLGGEVVTSELLDRVRQRFPEARVTLIYASAELGVIAKTNETDGWFPIDSLRSSVDIRDGRLFVQEENGGWRDTGDRVEMRSERMRVLGRCDRVVNVGAEKIALEDVEAAIEAIAGVRCARASATPNPVVGQVVAVEVDLEPGVEPRKVEEEARRRLPKAAWPRTWDYGVIALGPNGKRRVV